LAALLARSLVTLVSSPFATQTEKSIFALVIAGAAFWPNKTPVDVAAR
jgi:hypothetical protein